MQDIILGLLKDKKYDQLNSVLRYLAPQDLAEILSELESEDPSYLILVFRLLSKEAAAETFVEMDSLQRERLIRSFTDAQLRGILDELYLDDTVDLIEEMPANVVRRILKNTDPHVREQINALLKYGSDTAGSIMTVEYVSLKEEMTVEDAFARIRRVGVEKETVYTCYVTDSARHLIGVATVKKMLLASPQTKIGELMERNVISVTTGEDKEVVAQAFRKYGFLALPVVDAENRMVGIVTVDDAMDVLQEENTEDIQKMAAMLPSEKPYLKTGVFQTWKQRIPWLMVLMISATFTGMIISGFEAKLQAVVALTAFIPMLMDTGGNCGSQASVSVIRGLALGEIRFRQIGKIVWKEFRVALLCGVSLGAVSFAKVILIDKMLMHVDGVDATVALVVATALAVTVILAKLIGCTLPLAAKKIGFDPAVMASPFITTIVDALALLAYFGIACTLLADRFV